MMKMYFFIFAAVLSICFSGCKNRPDESAKDGPEILDVVIVGGGMAGLSTGYHLMDKKIAVLEKDNRVGGRIFNKDYEGIKYTAGATFGYDTEMIPDELKDQCFLANEKNPRGILLDGKFYLGDNFLSAVDKLLSPKEKESYAKYLKYEMSYTELMNDLSGKEWIVNSGASFFIEIERPESVMTKKYRPDAYFIDFDMVDFYKGKLSQSIILGAEVTAVVSKGSVYETTYQKGGKDYKLLSLSVVVATPADVAEKIIKNHSEKSLNFLSSIKYFGTGTVIIIVKNNPGFLPFTYIATPGKRFHTIYRHVTSDKKHIEYLVSFSEDYFKNTGFGILDQTISDLRTMNMGDFSKENIVKTDLAIWSNLVSTRSEDMYMKVWSPEALNPVPGLFLAGDYTVWSAQKMPYGVFQAWRSGKMAAKSAKDFLNNKNREKNEKF